MKRIIALALALVMCLAVFCSCSKKDPSAPSGMKLASGDNVDYYMYVPEVSGEVKFTDPALAESRGAKLERVVEGDPDFSAENAGMGVLQYRLTHTSANCSQATLQMPTYAEPNVFTYASWLTSELKDGVTMVTMSPTENKAKSHITYHSAGGAMVVYLYCVFEKAAAE